MSYDQHSGDAASDPPAGSNLMFTAHIYPGTFGVLGQTGKTFQTRLATAFGKSPVFITE
jgi:hypothetical protein